MRRWKVTQGIVAAAMTACLLCFGLAEAKKPDNPGGGGGGDMIASWSNGNAVTWAVILDGAGGLLAGPATILDPGAEATGVNNVGMVCGFGHLGPSWGGDGVVCIDGGQAELLDLDSSRTWNSPHNVFPFDVNDNGVIVGYNFAQAVIWPRGKTPERPRRSGGLDAFRARGFQFTLARVGHIDRRASGVSEWGR